MSYESTKLGFDVLSLGLQKRYEEGSPVRLTVDGRPKLHILSFQPLVYEQYGHIFKRGPHIYGSLALRTFLTAPHPYGGAFIYAGVQAGDDSYGLEMDGYNSAHRVVITDVARALGHSEFELNPPRL
jgi:hypothetical protein